MACFTPWRASSERRMRSSRHWQRIWMETSAGMRFSSIRRRQNSNSIWEADGKPTSISLKPISTSRSKYSSFSSTLMGWARAWLPSRRSTLHQIGACVSVRLGHWRLGRRTGGNGRYFVIGGFCMTKGRVRAEKGEGGRNGGRFAPGKTAHAAPQPKGFPGGSGQRQAAQSKQAAGKSKRCRAEVHARQ